MLPRNLLKALPRSYGLQVASSLKPEGWDEALPFEKIPGPKGLPIVGNTWRFLPWIGPYHNVNFLEIMQDFQEKYDKICVLTGIPFVKPIVILMEPEGTEALYRGEGPIPRRELGAALMKYYKHTLRKEKFKGNYGLVMEEGEDWHKTRKVVNPIMLPPKANRRYTSDIDQIGAQLVENIRKLLRTSPEMPEDFKNELKKFGLEAVMFVALDKRLGCMALEPDPHSEAQKIIDAVSQINGLILKLDFALSLWRYYNTGDYKRFVCVMDFLAETFGKYVDGRREEVREELKSKPNDEMSILERLLKVDRDLAFAMSLDLLSAGMDTISRVLGAALYFLAKNPKAQTRLRVELKKQLPTKNSPITNEALEQLPYLKAVVKETVRLAPVTLGAMRTATEDMVLCGYRIPKGVHVGAAHITMSRNAEYFPRPLEFLPERWLKHQTGPLSYKNAPAFASMPFGFGARSCVGRRLAELELYVTIGKIIRNFSLNWPHSDAEFSMDVVYGISSPLKFHVKEEAD